MTSGWRASRKKLAKGQPPAPSRQRQRLAPLCCLVGPAPRCSRSAVGGSPASAKALANGATCEATITVAATFACSRRVDRSSGILEQWTEQRPLQIARSSIAADILYDLGRSSQSLLSESAFVRRSGESGNYFFVVFLFRLAGRMVASLEG
jgi:hypothetical protein